ncbi:MAG: GNAT family N-acetyltransferase/peptidase C39 family protein [Cellvibrionaceae bacterium]
MTNHPQPINETATQISIRTAAISDLNSLHTLEIQSFDSDQLSKRRLKHWISAKNGICLIAEKNGLPLGYGLVLLHRGTRLARLYSLAVDKNTQGQGIGKILLQKLEEQAVKRGRLFMRLEVAQDNVSALTLYKKLGYVQFGAYDDYYEDHRSAERMQKRIRYVPENLKTHIVPWYQQTTDFTCGPASAMMAMASLDSTIRLNQELELDIWREATTIFMMSGHGGCHPIGLALAAKYRHFDAKVMISEKNTLFVDSVRDENKKNILHTVHNEFIAKAKKNNVEIIYDNVTQDHIEHWLHEGALVLVLISTYRMDYKKSPHWVTVVAIDDECLYVHDPDPTEGEQNDVDCQYLPIARDDFDKMSLFGQSRLRTAVIISKP